MSLARAANIAWDNGDMAEFDRLSCRDLDRTIAEMTDANALKALRKILAALRPSAHGEAG